MLQPTTLRGVFPERKPPPKKDFIKENVRRLRLMQEPRMGTSDSKVCTDKPKSNQPKLKAHLSKTNTSSWQNDANANARRRQPGIQRLEIKPLANKRNNRSENASQLSDKEENKLVNRGMQTEHTENVENIYSTGTIRYPSPACLTMILKNRKMFPRRNNNLCHGDPPNADLQKDAKLLEKDVRTNPNSLPPSYKRGTVPKYIKQKKDVVEEGAGDVECPPGHVLLPEEERKETLRVLRESYAEKIQELNCMPVRSDTLRMQKRKIELEEELKKIDEGVKVFQRPKVFVKINV